MSGSVKEGDRRHLPRCKPRLLALDVTMFAGITPSLEPDMPQATREGLVEIIRTKVTDPLVVNAFQVVDRALFVPDDARDLAYSNKGGILLTETAVMSQPSMVARMTEPLGLTGQEKVLEIGTGLGYGAAILSKLAREVHSIEIDSELAAQAAGKLDSLGFDNVTVHQGDGLLGLPEEAPFDAILVTGGIEEDVIWPLVAQLAVGGRIVAPVSDGDYQLLSVGVKRDAETLVGQYQFRTRVTFLPLIAAAPTE